MTYDTLTCSETVAYQDNKRMQPLDERDRELLDIKVAYRKTRHADGEMLEGDYVQFPDGSRARIFYIFWDDSYQLDDRCGSTVYLGNDYASASGAGGPSVRPQDLTLIGRDYATFWFFSHEHSCAGGGVHVRIPVNVYAHPGPWRSFGHISVDGDE